MASTGSWAKRVLLTSLLCLVPQAGAVIIDIGNGAGNIDAPPFPASYGWNNVGAVNGASGVYLGNRWVLTASHVDRGTINFAGLGDFSPEPISSSTYRHLTNPDHTLADLVLFRLTADPGLPSLDIASSTPTVASNVTMVGYGKDRWPPKSYWDAAWNPADPSSFTHSGYFYGAGANKRWGSSATVTADGTNPTVFWEITSGSTSYGYLTLLATQFTDDGSQAAPGDSGGAVFVGNTLAGLMDMVDSHPIDVAAFGDRTYSADLSAYRDQIIAVIPEPSTTLLALAGAGLFLARRTRRSA